MALIRFKGFKNVPLIICRLGTDPGQVTGTGHRKGCPVPGDLGSGTKWVQWVLAKDKFDS